MMLQLMEGLYGEEVKELGDLRVGVKELFRRTAEENQLDVDM